MPVDPQTQTILKMLNDIGAEKFGSGTPEQARAFSRDNRFAAKADPAKLAQVGSIDDRTIAVPHGKLAVRIYRPAHSGPAPTVVYFHGGGFVIGDLDSHDDHGRLICRDVDAVVVSVDYRLAPEHRFPEPLNDALAATRWAAAHIDLLGGDPDRLAVAGDSAGGNLAAAVAVAARTTGPRLAAQLLVYPKTDMTDNDAYKSRVDYSDGYFLTGAIATWFQDHYLSAADAHDPRASVILAPELSDVAPAVVGVGEYDLLRDEVVAYAQRLAAAHVPVALHVFPGLIHAFYGMGLMSSAAADAISVLNNDFRLFINGGSGV